MKILKLIAFFVLVYFIRRIFSMYREMKKIQEEQMAKAQQQPPKNADVVDAEYKVID